MAANDDFEKDGINKERVVAYLLGELSEQEKLAFELELQHQPALAEYTDSMRAMMNTLKAGLSEDKEKEALAATLQSNRGAFFAPKRHIPRIAYFSAAAAILAVVLLLWPKQHSSTREWEQITMMSFTERGNTTDSLLIAASGKFNQQAFSEALTLLNTVLDSLPNHQTALFYRGIAAYMTQDIILARKDLERVASGSSIFQYEAIYYLALSFAEDKDSTIAIKWLNKIPAGTPVSAKATTLLKRLQ